MNIGDGEHIHCVIKVDGFATDDRSDEFTRAIKNNFFNLLDIDTRIPSHAIKEGGELCDDAFHNFGPEDLEQAKERSGDEQSQPEIAKKFKNKGENHAPSPWIFR